MKKKRKEWKDMTKKEKIAGIIGLSAVLIVIVLGVSGAFDETEEEKAEREARQEQREQERTEKKAAKEQKKVDEEKAKKEAEAEKDKNEEAKKEEKKLTPEEDLNKKFADISHGELLGIGGVFDEEPFSMQIEYLGSENLTNNMTVKGMKISILDAVYIAKESGYEIENLGISMKYPLVDKYGNTEDEYVIKSTFSKETLDKLSDDKNKINKDNLDAIADSWWEHPAIRE